MNAGVINLKTSGGGLGNKDLKELVKLYAEVRDIYEGNEQYFDDQSKAVLDQKLDEIGGVEVFNDLQSGDPDKIKTYGAGIIPNMHSFLELLLQKINENIKELE